MSQRNSSASATPIDATAAPLADDSRPVQFNQQDGFANDQCVTTARNRTNESLMRYRMWRDDGGGSCEASLARDQRANEFGLKHLSMRVRNNGGGNACLVDAETDLRLNALWNREKAKTQLFNRFYTAAPNLSKGRQNIEAEDRLVHGESTAFGKQCAKGGAGKELDRFIPLLPCLRQQLNDPNTKVPPFNPIGEDSREMMRNIQPSFTRCELRKACASAGLPHGDAAAQ
jgi:hypothetical protein